MRKALMLIVTVSLLIGCSRPEKRQESSLSRKQRDSVLSESEIPGAEAVRKAIEVSDSASARPGRIDRYTNQIGE